MKKSSLIKKFSILLIIYAAVAIIFSSIITYIYQNNNYKGEYETTLNSFLDYVEVIHNSQMQEFENVRNYFLENADKILIPFDMDIKSTEFQYDYYRVKEEYYPNLIIDKDIAFDNLNDEVKLAYVKYHYLNFLCQYEQIRESMNIDHLYFMYPVSETEFCYIIDFQRFDKEIDGKKYIDLGVVAAQDKEKYPVLYKVLESKNGSSEYDVCDTTFGKDYVFYRPIMSGDKFLGLAVIEENYFNVSENILLSVSGLSMISLLIMLVCTYFAIIIIRKNLLKPIVLLENYVMQYSENMDDSISEKLVGIKSNDEIGTLAVAFSNMIISIRKHVDDIKQMVTERERNHAELSVATNIQKGFLPKVDSISDEYNRFEINASMDPAKEVGGDFYDFFKIDDDHLALIIADVSGKGVPASLFMMISKVLLKNTCGYSMSPKDILETVNNKLCENNVQEMFVTVWLGILDLNTGVMKCANAGHEFPAIRKKNTMTFELIKDKHGFVLGGMEGLKYKEYEIQLEDGDSLFVYTDGVAEATNANNELYGTDRMLEALNRDSTVTINDRLSYMRKDIDNFVKEAPQFDDITMLTIDYHAKNN